MTDLPKKTMYRVEKWESRECPHCGHYFQNRGEHGDFVLYFGRIVDGKKERDPDPWKIICMNCNEVVKITILEEYQVGDIGEADRLCNEEGFFNMLAVEAVGNMTQNMHTVHTERPTLIKVDCN